LTVNLDVLLTTVEVRWFFAGSAPADMHTWFVQHSAAVTSEPRRVDHYLLVRDTDALGIKFREGRIEVKQRVHSLYHIDFGRDQVGAVECWRKWGFPLASVESGTPLEELDAWVAVAKRRWLCDYRIDAEGRLAPLEAPDPTIPTCSVELTDICTGGQAAWTLAFEAAGPSELLEPTLRRVARHVLATCSDCELRLEHSFGYPQWLRLIHT
jgi:hypothetical protein